MKKSRKNLLAIFGALALVAVGAGVYNLSSVSANAAEETTETISATTDVEFRLTGEYGLRFKTTVDASFCDAWTAENSGVTTGVLVMPADLFSGELTLETSHVGNGVTYDASKAINEWVVSEDGKTAESYAYLVDIPQMSYTRNLTVRSYYTTNGVTKYFNPQTTSLTCIAQELLQLDAEDDTVLTDEIAALVAQYVADYTVVFKDELTGEVLSRTSVSPADATVAKPETDPTIEGYTFKGWYVGDKEWDFEKDVLTGDTLITAKYDAIQYAPNSLDFSKYTVMPAFVTENIDRDLHLENGKLMNTWAYINNQGIFIAYDSLELKAGDKIIVTAELLQGTFNVGINGSYAGGYKNAAGDATCTIQIKNATTLTSLSIYSTNDNPGSKYTITSIEIEMAERYAPLNLDFANYETLPLFVSYTTGAAPTIVDGNLTAWYGNKKYTQISYDNIALKQGDEIVITCTTSATVGMNVDLNGTSVCDKWISAGTTNGSVTITINEATTLSSIGFYCSSAAGLTFKLASIVINQA